MICDWLDALNLLENLGRRVGFRLGDTSGCCDSAEENSPRLFPNSLLKRL